MLETAFASNIITGSSRKSDRQVKRVFNFELDGDSSMDIKTENGAQDRDFCDGEESSQIPSPASTSPYVSSNDGCRSPISENSRRNLQSYTDCEVEDFLVEALLTIKSSVVIPEQPMQVELLNGKSPRAKQTPKNNSLQQNVKYEYVSQTCEEHKKKHLRCPVNCKGRVLVKVARAISEDQHTISEGEESFLDSFDLENTSDNENRFSFSKKRSQSSLSDDEPTGIIAYQDQDEYLPYKSKKRQPGIFKKNTKKSPKKLDEDEDIGRKGKMSNVGRSMSADSFENKKPSEWNGETIAEKQNFSDDDVITHSSKKQKTQPEEELNDLMDIQCRVSSSSVATASAEIANKSKRWIRFACEDHRKKHVKCPENCPNRKTEFVFGNAGNGAE